MKELVVQDKKFNEYFNDIQFEMSNPSTYFQRIDISGMHTNTARDALYGCKILNPIAMSSIDAKLKIEYMNGKSRSNGRIDMAYFETDVHKIFMFSGIPGIIDRVIINDKLVEAARVNLRKKDIFTSAGDHTMGVSYGFDSKEGYKNIAEFISTIVKYDLNRFK